MTDDHRARIIAMTEPEFSAYLAASPLHRHHHERERQWRRDNKAALRAKTMTRVWLIL